MGSRIQGYSLSKGSRYLSAGAVVALVVSAVLGIALGF